MYRQREPAAELSYNRRMQHIDLVVIHTFGSQPEAELARGALEAAGIDAMIQADSVGGMRPHIAWGGSGFRLLVRQEDVKDAREVLEPEEDRGPGPA